MYYQKGEIDFYRQMSLIVHDGVRAQIRIRKSSIYTFFHSKSLNQWLCNNILSILFCSLSLSLSLSVSPTALAGNIKITSSRKIKQKGKSASSFARCLLCYVARTQNPQFLKRGSFTLLKSQASQCLLSFLLLHRSVKQILNIRNRTIIIF